MHVQPNGRFRFAGVRLTNVILITIGIIIAASAALMSVFYGGGAMSHGSVRAQAATLENAAQNVRAGMTGRRFRGDRSVPTNISHLVVDDGPGSGLASRSDGNAYASKSWLSSLPQIEGSGASGHEIMTMEGVSVYAARNVPEGVCLQVNRDYRGSGASIPASRGGHPRGCIRAGNGEHVFYSVL